ncbi:putative enoyl-CoA hydratase echA8 [Agaricicola taiwanensis]|uniref:Putative enoyl-CoA hydratase echA8 n=1 Tax=Agaricicola taiwanensis TaxID=591372 RepID=A0A8J2VMZ4_9RHOB|nr:enoyl-CoA hydratase/isomerase family protein [Agaricicola taiwanensis]GGE31738.1 putative enoyl-CoA hydratase echA8 [Agaricicola taiwanensis]
MLDITIANRVATLTINRPQRRNALAAELVAKLTRAFADLDNDPNVGAVVLAGAAPSFCAGSDLKELGTMDVPGMVANEADTAAMARRIGLVSVPVVAAVEGYALGGGFILAASCDLVVTGADARWSLPEVPNGWLPPWGLQALVARVGPVNARRLVWGFETLDGEEARRLGVADYCVPSGEAASHAATLAARIAALPAPAVRSTKEFFQQAISVQAEAWDAAAGRIFADNCAHETARATLARFAAKV